jgi:hypothetical protein
MPLPPATKAELVDVMLSAVRSRCQTHDQQTDVLSLLALEANGRVSVAATSIRRHPKLYMLLSSHMEEVAEAALLKHLEAVTVELTPQGEIERLKAEAANV